ncbi:TRAP transporter substrate-binding protein [Inquilinus limosus]|uniref:TRAP transporter substrate-binding protein n=1 Tax=Inquilinus limosus TaxID=171674 RepID=UPI003F15176B
MGAHRRGFGSLQAGLAFAAAVALAAGPAVAETWDMPTAYTESNFHTGTAQAFAACVKEATAGEIDIVVHPSGSLFKGNDIKRAVQTGQAPIGERLISAHQNENPIFGVDSIPFLVTSFEDSARLWRVTKPVVEKILDGENLVLLYSVPWPPQGLYFKKPVASNADIKGLKFRAYNAATARFAELAGLNPVQIEEAELPQALATGVVESFLSSGATGYDRKVWEQLTNFYTVDAWLPRNYVFANKDSWDGLDDATRAGIRGCASLAEYAGYWRAVQYTDFTVGQLAAHGMTVEKPSDGWRAELVKIGDTMTQEWLAKAGADGQAIVDAYKAAK